MTSKFLLPLLLLINGIFIPPALGGGEDSGVGKWVLLQKASLEFEDLIEQQAPFKVMRTNFYYEDEDIRLPGLRSRFSGLRGLCIEGEYLRTIYEVKECHQYELKYKDKFGRDQAELFRNQSPIHQRQKELKKDGATDFESSCAEGAEVSGYQYLPTKQYERYFRVRFFAKPPLSDVIRDKVDPKTEEWEVGEAQMPFMKCEDIREKGKTERAIWKTADELKVISI